MNNRAYSLIFLLIAATLSMNLSGAEFKQDDYKGMQLAWVRLPSTSATKEGTDSAKPKPAQAPVIKPIQAPIIKPTQLPAAKPVQVPVAKPTPLPEVKPAPTPLAKPVQDLAVKPTQAPVAEEKYASEWVIGLGADFGGEELGKVYYTDGSSASVNANKGVAFNIGGIIVNGKGSAFSTQMTLGYKFGGPRGTGGDVTWSAIPLEIIEYYHASSLRMGLGLSYQISPQLSVNLPASSYINKYNNAVGLIAQIGWVPAREHYSIDLRYTSIKFQSSDVQDAPMVDGSVSGLYASYRF